MHSLMAKMDEAFAQCLYTLVTIVFKNKKFCFRMAKINEMSENQESQKLKLKIFKNSFLNA